MKSFQIPILSMSLLGFCLFSSLDTPPAYADFTFGEQVNPGPVVNSPGQEQLPVLSPDGLELYFGSSRSGGYGGLDIWVTKRSSPEDPWDPPANLGPQINVSGFDGAGGLSADGLTLYFSQGPWGNCIACMTTRTAKDAPWGPPIRLGPPFTPYECPGPISSDGVELFVSGARPGGCGSVDIWVTRRATPSDPWGALVNLGATVNSPSYDFPVWLSSDDLTLLFSSDRPGGFGSWDLWMTTRPSKGSAWGPAQNLGPRVNTAYSECGAAISPDGRWCYFDDYMAPRPGGLGKCDIWQAPIIPIVDFNGDGKVDLVDLVMMIDNWGTNNTLCDIGPMPWGDGVVDVKDLEVLMSYWGQELALVAHWALDETEGSTAHDSAGEHDASIFGPVWQPTGGKIDGALQFNGISDIVSTPFVLNPADGPFSVFAWLKEGAPGQVVLSQIGGADWLLPDPSEGKLMTSLSCPPGGRFAPPPLVSESVITDGLWHRIGFVWDGSNRILYVDDVEVAKDTQTGLASSAGGLYLGAGSTLSPGSFWSGLIDDVRIYDRAVTP